MDCKKVFRCRTDGFRVMNQYSQARVTETIWCGGEK